MKHKSETFAAFKMFKAYAEKQTEKLLKCLREDKGGEYMSNEFDAYLKECGIRREHSVRNRPQQNGVAERTNRTLGERITALLSEAGLSKAYWAECLSWIVVSLLH
jgi:transposase InsO family protein